MPVSPTYASTTSATFAPPCSCTKGVSVKVVQEVLGHSSVSVTMDVYSHVLPDMQEKAAAAMDGLLSDDR